MSDKKCETRRSVRLFVFQYMTITDAKYTRATRCAGHDCPLSFQAALNVLLRTDRAEEEPLLHRVQTDGVDKVLVVHFIERGDRAEERDAVDAVLDEARLENAQVAWHVAEEIFQFVDAGRIVLVGVRRFGRSDVSLGFRRTVASCVLVTTRSDSA